MHLRCISDNGEYIPPRANLKTSDPYRISNHQPVDAQKFEAKWADKKPLSMSKLLVSLRTRR